MWRKYACRGNTYTAGCSTEFTGVRRFRAASHDLQVVIGVAVAMKGSWRLTFTDPHFTAQFKRSLGTGSRVCFCGESGGKDGAGGRRSRGAECGCGVRRSGTRGALLLEDRAESEGKKLQLGRGELHLSRSHPPNEGEPVCIDTAGSRVRTVWVRYGSRLRALLARIDPLKILL